MPNVSFLAWQGCLRCDGPNHKRDDESSAPPDWIYDAARTATEYKNEARRQGWKFKRDGRVLCPECVKDGAQ
jgi:hypothetical protein